MGCPDDKQLSAGKFTLLCVYGRHKPGSMNLIKDFDNYTLI